MTRLKLFFFCFLLVLPLYADDRYFSSNEFGMVMKEIGWYRQDEFPYVLKLSEQGQTSKRTLYESGTEIKRWERTANSEKFYQQLRLSEIRIYDNKGRLIEEQLLGEDGEITKTIYFYDSHALVYSTTSDGQGNYLYRDDFRLSPERRLLGVERTWADGGQEGLTLNAAGGRIFQERNSNGQTELLYRFDSNGRLYDREQWTDRSLALSERFRYDGDRLLAAVEIDSRTGLTTRREFDDEGRIVTESVERDGVEVERRLVFWDSNGQKIRIELNGEQGLEELRYSYDSEGTLVEEEYWSRGGLEKRVLYIGPDQQIEELYRDEEIFMRIHFEDDQKWKEEFLDNGKVIRLKLFGNGE